MGRRCRACPGKIGAGASGNVDEPRLGGRSSGICGVEGVGGGVGDAGDGVEVLGVAAGSGGDYRRGCRSGG